MITKIQSQKHVQELISLFNTVWGAETLSELICNIQTNICLLNIEDKTEQVVGYLFYDLDIRENFYEITDFAVLQGKRGRGFGRELIAHLQQQTKCIRLCVKSDNISAKELYYSLGFEVTQIIQNYYGVGYDGLRMEWNMNAI